MSQKGSDIGTLAHARTPEQILHMNEYMGQKKCPFCDIDRTVNPHDVVRNSYWWATENAWPYPYHMYHFVIPSVEHWVNIGDVSSSGAVAAFITAVQLINNFNIPGGALIMRYGNAANNGSTLNHLHMQLQVPSRLGQSFVTIGNPDESQVDETVALLMGEKNHEPSWLEVANRGEYWCIYGDTKKRPHTLHNFRMDLHLRTHQMENLAMDRGACIEFFIMLHRLQEKYYIPGAAFVLRFGKEDFRNDGNTHITVNLVSADGTGPVFEVLHPAYNRNQAMRSMKHLVKKK